MNICILNLRENNPYIGGVERITYTLAQQWEKRGHQVILLSQYKSSIQKQYTSACEEFFLPNPEVVLSDINIKFISNIIKKYRVAIVLNQASVFPDLCKLAKRIKIDFDVKVITVIHYSPLFELAGIENNFFLYRKSVKSLFVSFLLYIRYYLYHKKFLKKEESRKLREIASYSDRIVCLSDSFIPTFKLLIGKKYSSKLYAIPNAINLIPENCLLHKKKQVLFVGRLEFGLKRVDRLIKIWKKVETQFKDWNLCIVGDGNAKSQLEKMVLDYGLTNVRFEGFKNPNQYYKDSSILCLTSSSEGFGMVLIEALLQQCVPIAYHSFSSIDDIICNGVNGIYIKPFDENEYVHKLELLMKNKTFREGLAKQHMMTLYKFDLNSILDKWDILFKELN